MTDKVPYPKPEGSVKAHGMVGDYVAIARLDHSTKHVFIIPGMVLAYLLRGVHTPTLILNLVLGVTSAVCIASANYVINEWLDREFDKFHPKKSQRSAVQRALSGHVVGLEWLVLVIAGIFCAYLIGASMLCIAAVFALQGLVYNVRPMRTKDTPYLDVISESINNPLRLMIGWAIVDPETLPPASIILSYWLGGAYLMAAKRLSEYREICASHGPDLLARYRASFAGYSETSLTVSCFVYGILSSFFLAIFLVKYRIEYILLMPVVAALFGHYLALSMQSGSSAQNPEKLFRERGLIFLVLFLAVLFIVATIFDFPVLASLTEQRFISIR